MDHTNERKICHAFLWANGLSEAEAATYYMRQADADFNKKLRFMSPHYDEQGVEQEEKDKEAEIEFQDYVRRIGSHSYLDDWNRKCSDLEEFCRVNKRLPIRNGDNLRSWTYLQLQLYDDEKLLEEPRNRLMAIDEFRKWAEDPWRGGDKRWAAKYQAFVDYCHLHKELPPHNSEDEETQQLYKWMINQQTLFSGTVKTPFIPSRLGKLLAIEEFGEWAEDTFETLDTKRQSELMAIDAFREWFENRDTSAIKKGNGWNALYQAFFRHCQLHHKLPKRNSEDQETQKISNWLKRQQQQFSGTVKKPFIPSRLGKLLAIEEFGEWAEAAFVSEKFSVKRRSELLSIDEFREWFESRAISDIMNESKASPLDKSPATPDKKKPRKKSSNKVKKNHAV